MIRRCFLIIAAWILVATVAGCGSSAFLPSLARPGAAAAPTQLAGGPVTVIALGDSLTAGQGDDSGQGYLGPLTETIAARPGREGSTVMNLGQSGWTSTMLVDGQEDVPAQLKLAVDEMRGAADGTAVLATVLIGSNDLWYAYENSSEQPTSSADEDAVVTTYRTNLDRTVRELQDAGAVVIVGLPDDQSLRSGVADIDRLNQLLPNITAAEVEQMSRLAQRLARVAEEVAVDRGALTVDTNDAFWSDQAKMADDGVHPNATGYTDLAALWTKVIAPVL